MEFTNINAVVIITLLLLIVCISYVIYFMYYRIEDLKTDVDKIYNSETNKRLTDIEEKINSFESDAEYVDDEEELEDEEEYDEDEDEDEELNELGVVGLKKRLENNTFDQFIMNSEQLQHLQNLQNEIQGTNLEEIPEEDEVEEDIVHEEDFPIEFSKTEPSKCKKLLTIGKNKGNECLKDAIHGSEFCKSHNKN